MNTKIDQINFCYLGLPLCLELCPTRNSLTEAVDTGTSPGNNRSSIGVDSVAKNLRGQGRLNVHIRLSRDFCVDIGLGWNLLVYVRNCSLRPLLSSSSSRPLGDKVLISLLLKDPVILGVDVSNTWDSSRNS